MTTVEIADIDAALGKVRAFIALLEQNHAAWDKTGIYADPSPQRTQTDNQIQEQLPLIIRIADRADADLAVKMQKSSGAYGWPYYSTVDAARQLAGLPAQSTKQSRSLARSDRS